MNTPRLIVWTALALVLLAAPVRAQERWAPSGALDICVYPWPGQELGAGVIVVAGQLYWQSQPLRSDPCVLFLEIPLHRGPFEAQVYVWTAAWDRIVHVTVVFPAQRAIVMAPPTSGRGWSQ